MTTMFEDLMTGLDEVDAFLGGETTGYRVSVPAEVDVKAIRQRLKMTQASFSDTFGFSLDAVKHWEGGRRTPESSARAFLTVIARDPRAVIAALHPPTMANAMKSSKASAKKGRWRATKSKPIKVVGRGAKVPATKGKRVLSDSR
jgi:putative transcriptional regulator